MKDRKKGRAIVGENNLDESQARSAEGKDGKPG
jgi:hypothetical protein